MNLESRNSGKEISFLLMLRPYLRAGPVLPPSPFLLSCFPDLNLLGLRFPVFGNDLATAL